MLQVVEKADDRARAERLLAQQEKNVRAAFNRFVAGAQRIDVAALLADPRARMEGVLTILDRHIAQLGNALSAVFVDAATSEAAALGRKLTIKAKPTVSLVFDPGDERAAELMRANKLNFVANLTSQQRAVTREALVRGMSQGLGPRDMARMFRDSIGLSPAQQAQLDNYRATLTRANTERAFLAPGEEPAFSIPTPKQIETMVASQAKQLVAARAEAIARTESLRITSMARTEAVRQSMQATGQQHAGREWASTHDGRTRADHAEADGQRRRLDQPYSVGGEQISAPGQGSARQSINCRCTELFEFFDSEQELRAWLQAGT